MNNILSQITMNTECLRNVDHAYECVLTIMNIKLKSGLKILEINILRIFLSHIDNNKRYIVLNMLSLMILKLFKYI